MDQLKRRDRFGIIHYKRSVTTCFTLCEYNPKLQYHIGLYGFLAAVAPGSIVNCLACLALEGVYA